LLHDVLLLNDRRSLQGWALSCNSSTSPTNGCDCRNSKIISCEKGVVIKRGNFLHVSNSYTHATAAATNCSQRIMWLINNPRSSV
jgi:hypothetical protein